MILNFFTGLAYELWAKIDLEDPMKVKIATDAELEVAKTAAVKKEVNKIVFQQDFINTAKELGLSEKATEHFCKLSEKKGGYELGLKTLFSKDKKWIEAQNELFRAEVAEASDY